MGDDFLFQHAAGVVPRDGLVPFVLFELVNLLVLADHFEDEEGELLQGDAAALLIPHQLLVEFLLGEPQHFEDLVILDHVLKQFQLVHLSIIPALPHNFLEYLFGQFLFVASAFFLF
jgi:hypothetical protein